jgi:hypothetical protein
MSVLLVSDGAEWRYLDDGSSLGTGWSANGFDDSQWSQGLAEFGYGDSDEQTVIEFGGVGNDKHITTYFRKSFTVTDPTIYNALDLEAIHDDGIAVYLNGDQIWSDNMPDTFDSETHATRGMSGSDESEWVTQKGLANTLRAGENVLAVEIHQSSASSSDLSFDFKLIGGLNDAPIVADMAVDVVHDSYVDFYLSGTDPDGDAITFSLDSAPENGTATLYGSIVTYTPDTNFSGSDTFTYTASDGNLSSIEKTITVNTVAPKTDEELMLQVQQDTFKYFWDESHPTANLTLERIHLNDPNLHTDVVTTGGSGFGLMNVIMGIENGFITRDEGILHLDGALDFLGTADRFHGAWSHWIDGSTGKAWAFSEFDDGGDLIETAFLAQGLIILREYFKNGTDQEKQLAQKADDLWKGIDWDWYTQGQDTLYWHWSENYGWKINLPISGYNEGIITYILAASSPNHSVDASVYHNGWASTGEYFPEGWIENDESMYGIPIILKHGGADDTSVGPMFLSHYSNIGLDPRGLTDRYADNYLDVVTNHAKIIHEYSIQNPKNYEGYSSDVWGLTASYSYDPSKSDNTGYFVHQPGDDDLGVITPTAALSSLPYTPAESLDLLRYLYEGSNGDYLTAVAGPIDAFSIHHQWKPERYLAIDQGPIGPMIENYKTQLFWDLFMNAPDIKVGLLKLGFSSSEHNLHRLTDGADQFDISNELTNQQTHATIFSGDGDDTVTDSSGDDFIMFGSGSDTLNTSSGADLIYKAGGGSLTINASPDGVWGHGYYAQNVGLANSIGTENLISLAGLNRFHDTLALGDSQIDVTVNASLPTNATTGLAVFTEDVFSPRHSDVNTIAQFFTDSDIEIPAGLRSFSSVTPESRASFTINGSELGDLFDFTTELITAGSPIDGYQINYFGHGGDDVIWGSAHANIDGGAGDDIINGGYGDNTLTGGSGSDIFEFTATSGNDTITDFNKDEDELHFYFREGEAEETAVASINNGVVTWDAVTVDLGDSSLAISDLNITYEMI